MEPFEDVVSRGLLVSGKAYKVCFNDLIDIIDQIADLINYGVEYIEIDEFMLLGEIVRTIKQHLLN